MSVQPALLSLAGTTLHYHLCKRICYLTSIHRHEERHSVDFGFATDANVPLLYGGDIVPQREMVRLGMQAYGSYLQRCFLRQCTSPQDAMTRASEHVAEWTTRSSDPQTSHRT